MRIHLQRTVPYMTAVGAALLLLLLLPSRNFPGDRVAAEASGGPTDEYPFAELNDTGVDATDLHFVWTKDVTLLCTDSDFQDAWNMRLCARQPIKFGRAGSLGSQTEKERKK